jgi:polycystin 1L2
LTNYAYTQCFSTHLTTFAGGFAVLPDSVDWSYVFANADFMKNKTIYLTVICVSAMYIILTIYARVYDKKDLEKLGVTVLPDNHPSDQYLYQIIVFTGQRKDAGTTSNVSEGDKSAHFPPSLSHRFML